MKHRGVTAEARRAVASSDAALERSTARKWCAMSLACLERYESSGSSRWLARALDYRHEALEHAALVGDGGRLVGQVQRATTSVVKANDRRRA